MVENRYEVSAGQTQRGIGIPGNAQIGTQEFELDARIPRGVFAHDLANFGILRSAVRQTQFQIVVSLIQHGFDGFAQNPFGSVVKRRENANQRAVSEAGGSLTLLFQFGGGRTLIFNPLLVSVSGEFLNRPVGGFKRGTPHSDFGQTAHLLESRALRRGFGKRLGESATHLEQGAITHAAADHCVVDRLRL